MGLQHRRRLLAFSRGYEDHKKASSVVLMGYLFTSKGTNQWMLDPPGPEPATSCSYGWLVQAGGGSQIWE